MLTATIDQLTTGDVIGDFLHAPRTRSPPCTSSSRVFHAAPGEIRPGQEGAQGGAALLHDLYSEPDPFALLPHDPGNALDQPGNRCARGHAGA